MKLGVIFFHKNIQSIYKDRWIKKCVSSILNQTVQDFSIYEINYGGGFYSVLEGIPTTATHDFVSKKFDNHAEAMNFIIDSAFKDGCDFVFNTNLDDYYDTRRFEVQLNHLNSGYDLVSSDFCYIREEGEDDITILHKHIKNYGDIKSNLDQGHNMIAHPCVAYSKKFWENNRYVGSEIPREDLLLWYRSINNGFKFYICDEVLLNYRIHQNQITKNS